MVTNLEGTETQDAIKEVTKHIINKFDAKGDYEEGLMARCNQAVTRLRKIQQRNPNTNKSASDKEVKSCFSDFAKILKVDVSFIEKTYSSYLEKGGNSS